MEWWGWLVVVLVALALLVGTVLLVQAKRRSGGIRLGDQ